MSLNHPMIIEIWPGDWGLPTIDLECLKILALVKFSGKEYKIKVSKNPYWTPNGTLPVVSHGKHVFHDYDEVMSYLRIKNVSPDHGLSTVEEADSLAYTYMVKEKLFPALQYIWWLDEKNYIGLTRPWYCKVIPLPFNFYYPQRFVTNARKTVQAVCEAETISEIENKLYSDAEKCLTSLSVKLGEKDFMFGAHPTSLDAVVFAYLAPLLKAPFKNSILQNHLKSCTNLQKFVSRICQRYFPQDYQAFENKKKNEGSNKPNISPDVDSDYPHKTRNTILAALIATFAMTGYAFMVGLVQPPLIERNLYDEDVYYSGENYEEEN
ncbi:metaxin-1 isoform X2 [Halyomorpha halys]|uniref:metaxin-1 isoform X2 n=1 Tax=Halyomorpha halys TaxID=286706 RepID=UPI0006D4CEFA|nr:metaxin-1 isoform X2 [Halyomorpha halys]